MKPHNLHWVLGSNAALQRQLTDKWPAIPLLGDIPKQEPVMKPAPEND